jgi:hypothetical protein
MESSLVFHISETDLSWLALLEQSFNICCG